MPKMTIEIEFIGVPDMILQRPSGSIVRDFSRYLLSDYAKCPKPKGEKAYPHYNAILKWRVER